MARLIIKQSKTNKTMKTNLTEQIEKLQSELDRLKELNSMSEAKEGEWWWIKSLLGNYYLVLIKNELSCKCWFNNDWDFYNEKSEFYRNGLIRKATDSEVCQAFKKHLEANGWTKGCKFKSAYKGAVREYTGKLIIEPDGDIATIEYGNVIFNAKTLTMAELVKDEKIMVGENEVLFFNPNGGCFCNIGSSRFFYGDIEALLPSNPSLFGKILKRMEEGK